MWRSELVPMLRNSPHLVSCFCAAVTKFLILHKGQLLIFIYTGSRKLCCLLGETVKTQISGSSCKILFHQFWGRKTRVPHKLPGSVDEAGPGTTLEAASRVLQGEVEALRGRSEIEVVGCKEMGAVLCKTKQKNGCNMTIILCAFAVASIIKMHNNNRC